MCRQLGGPGYPRGYRHARSDGQCRRFAGRLLPLRPPAVINCAAYTNVDKVESEPESALAVNGAAVEHLAEICRELDCPLVQISTDYVFGGGTAIGKANRPFREDDPPAPQGVYAQTKLAGERAAAGWKKHLIVRTCGLYARPSDRRAKNFVKTMLQSAAMQKTIRVVNDQRCTPSYVPHVARAIIFLLDASHPAPARGEYITSPTEAM